MINGTLYELLKIAFVPRNVPIVMRKLCQKDFYCILNSYNECLAKTRVKVECVFGQMKKKFQVLTKKPDYSLEMMCKIVCACSFLWNFGILTGDNKGYCPDDFVIEDEEDLYNSDNEGETAGGAIVREKICHYLWDHR